MAPNDDRSMFSLFASLLSVAAFLLAAIGIVVVVNKDEGGATTAKAPPVPVTISEFKIAPASISVGIGGSLLVTNGGSQVHNLEIVGGPKTRDLAPGASQELDLSSLAPGTYDVLCNIPGHADAGMKGTLTVSAGAAAATTDTAAAGGHGGHSAADWAKLDQQMIDSANGYVNAILESAAAGGGMTTNGVPGLRAVPTEGVGNQKLEPEILPDGTKRFNLTAAITQWQVEPERTVEAWTYNGMVPSPWIRVEPGDRVQVVLKNDLPVNTDIHFHGITTPFPSDGVSPITQPPIKPGETYTYTFTAPDRPELGMYHPHNHGQVAVVNGMFGMFQVGDLPLPRGRTINGVTVPANLQIAQEIPMVLNDAGVIGLSLNGKGFPATDPIVSKVGDWHLVHYQNEGLQIHPMHLHHMPQLVVAKDGFPLEQPYWVDTLNVAPGERYSVLVQSRPEDLNVEYQPGQPAAAQYGIWAYHCHILTHAESDAGLHGMVTAWIVTP
ncbi:multicopper oxidase domain-containing protein [Rhabdothermincola sp.]|uniref:multicopper oxidase domain-containing protein n=1 Tax=Rhabdothermincola sp. TaxID=2820405 RepID=UPI002FE15C89